MDILEAVIKIVDGLVSLCLVVCSISMGVDGISCDYDSIHVIHESTESACNHSFIPELTQLDPGVIVLRKNISSVPGTQPYDKPNLRVPLDPVALMHKIVYK